MYLELKQLNCYDLMYFQLKELLFAVERIRTNKLLIKCIDFFAWVPKRVLFITVPAENQSWMMFFSSNHRCLMVFPSVIIDVPSQFHWFSSVEPSMCHCFPSFIIDVTSFSIDHHRCAIEGSNDHWSSIDDPIDNHRWSLQRSWQVHRWVDEVDIDDLSMWQTLGVHFCRYFNCALTPLDHYAPQLFLKACAEVRPLHVLVADVVL